MQLTIGRRVGLGVVATVLVTVALVLAASAALRATVQAKDDVIERSGALVADAHQLVASLNQEAARVRAYLLTADDRLLLERQEAAAEFTAVLGEIRQGARDAEVTRLVGELPDAKAAWADIADDLIAERAAGGSASELSGTAEDRLLVAFDRIEDLASAVATREERLIQVATAQANESAGAATQLLWWLGLAAVVLSAGAGAWAAASTRRRVEEYARSIDTACADILSSTEQQAASAAELAAAAQQTLATVEELSQTADETAKRARVVADSAQRSAESAEAGQDAVRDSIAGMAEVRQQGDSIAESILELAEQAQAISDIVGTVEDIAAQTHLLALNASIEAARAGEHGKGFAVVATEVRALAEESRRETERVADILGQIQRSTNGAVLATEEGSRTIASGEELVGSAGATIDELSDLISSATLTAEQISGSAGQQAAATSQITQAMRDVRTAIDQSAASARQSEAAARDLSGVAGELKALVGLR